VVPFISWRRLTCKKKLLEAGLNRAVRRARCSSSSLQEWMPRACSICSETLPMPGTCAAHQHMSNAIRALPGRLLPTNEPCHNNMQQEDRRC